MSADLSSPESSAGARGSANAEAEPRTACNGSSGLVGVGGVFRAAYADPPYPGLAHYYEGQGIAEEVDYAELLAKLDAEYDAYAVSIHMNGLREVLHRLDPKIRIGAWCKPWARFKRSIRVQYCWEPVLYYTSRNAPPKAGEAWGDSAAVRDYCLVNSSMKTVVVNGKKFKGVKPPDFCFWVFELLGLTPKDTLADIYPGSGAVSEAWNQFAASSRTLLGGGGAKHG